MSEPVGEARGLTSAEVEQRIATGKVNVNTGIKTKSVRELFAENLFTIFNLINLVLALLVLATGSWKNIGFLGIVVLNTGIGVVQALRSKRMVDKLTLLATKKAVVVRDGVEVELDLEQIVQDDLVKLGRGDQIPADAVVVSGEASVNESLLTGESDLIRKQPGDHLMSGSFLDSGLVFARVEHVGAENYVAKINAQAKYVKKVNSEIMNSLNGIVRFAGVLMIPIGIGLFWASASELQRRAGDTGGLLPWLAAEVLAGRVPSSAILSTVGALLGMIPQGLVLLTSSVLAIATVRLARKKVLAQQLYCIETLARVDVLCLDKTGTITSGHMEVAGTYTLDEVGAAAPAADDAASRRLALALSGVTRATAEDANETCQAILAHYASTDLREPCVERVVPFSSAKKWSGASFDGTSFVMGAAQFVLAPEAFARIEGAVSELAQSSRVLVVAEVDGFTEEGDLVGEARPLGLVTIRDEIRSSAAETIGYFKDQGVTLNVISGDDPRTVSGIAATVGIPGACAYVDATKLDTPAKIDAAVDRYHVFGRVTPEQKRELVCALKRRGHTVAMTGDGVNDVLALKEADCSVAMAAGSDAARNVAEIVLVDNDFASMPAVVAEGRRSINNLQRSAALFLTKTLFSMMLAVICIAFPPYPFEPIQMTLINFFCIGMPGFVLGLEPNRARVEGKFILNVVRRALPASAGVVAAALLCMASASFFGYSDLQLSTMCLVTTSAVATCLIWRISQPFTPLRRALLVVVVAGLAAGVLGFPGIFSIARLSGGMVGLMAVNATVGCVVFKYFADFMSRQTDHGRRVPATGFGRGVQVRMGKRSRRTVSSTGSSMRRWVKKVRSTVQRRREETARARAKERAEESAEQGLEQARPQEPRRVVKRVSRASDGIHVKIPRKKKTDK